MKLFKILAIALSFATISCTLDKTDYEDEISTVVPEYFEFKEAVSFTSGSYKISIEALNGTFYKGYNEIRLKITNSQTNQAADATSFTFLPIHTSFEGDKSSCPHLYDLEYDSEEGYFKGYVVFTSETSAMSNWELYTSFETNNEQFLANKPISVQTQVNKNLNMTEFIGNDGENYFIALVAPQKPSVAENQLVAGIYKYNIPTNPAGNFPDPSQFSYSEVSNYTLKLDPRMPEPSMGNHSSPNNRDLTQQADGLYHGVVNYTMTGNWTLNFIMQNQNDQIVKGTLVPTDFTPGVQGVKSELHIDTLF